MNALRNQRTLQIQTLSEYLRRMLRFAEYVLWLGWPLMLLIFTSGKMGTDLSVRIGSGVTAADADLLLPARVAVMLCGVLMLILTQLAVFYARQLMEHFSKGRIFDADAVATAKKAIRCGLGLFALQVLFEVGNAIYIGTIRLPGPAMTLFYGFLFFGLLHVMLWALEIGRDLNDESALTI